LVFYDIIVEKKEKKIFISILYNQI
jgi:hypothetical protein